MSNISKISRRKFVIIGITAFIGALFTSFHFFDFDTVVFRIIKADLNHLKISDLQIQNFVKDTKKENHWDRKFFDWKKQLFMRIGYLLEGLWQGFPYYYKYKQYRSEIVGDFLLSTDFFINRMDTNRELNYRAIYNPYKQACSNPFSNLYYPSI